MKKGIKLLLVSLFIIPFGVKAATVEVGLNCPDTANASSEVSCTITAKPSGSDLKGIQANFDITGGSYKSFTAGSGWTALSSSNKGISMQASSALTSQTTVGTLKVQMPASGSTTVALKNVAGTDSSYANLSGNNPSKTIRIKSTVNTLDSLTISGAEINFDKNTTTYNVTIDAASTVISATKTDQYSVVSGTGTKTLKYGKNTFNVVVTAESGAKKTYVINITRPDNRSTNNYLSSLKISTGTISFNKNTTTYNVEVESNVTKIKVEATTEDTKATFVNGYGPREVSLKLGKNAIQIKVKAENESEKVYTINVTRKDDRSSNANLSELKLSVGNLEFNDELTEYQIVVESNVEEITVTAKAEDSKAKVEYDTTKKLVKGNNEIIIKVTAENGTVKTYKVIVIRKDENTELDTNTSLKELTIEGYNIEFNSEKFEYNLTIKEEDKLNITATAGSEKALVAIAGNESLKNGSKIRIKVTSESGESKEYVINITKEEKKVTEETKDSNTMLYIGIGVFAVGLLTFAVAIVKKNKNK